MSSQVKRTPGASRTGFKDGTPPYDPLLIYALLNARDAWIHKRLVKHVTLQNCISCWGWIWILDRTWQLNRVVSVNWSFVGMSGRCGRSLGGLSIIDHSALGFSRGNVPPAPSVENEDPETLGLPV